MKQIVKTPILFCQCNSVRRWWKKIYTKALPSDIKNQLRVFCSLYHKNCRIWLVIKIKLAVTFQNKKYFSKNLKIKLA